MHAQTVCDIASKVATKDVALQALKCTEIQETLHFLVTSSLPNEEGINALQTLYLLLLKKKGTNVNEVRYTEFSRCPSAAGAFNTLPPTLDSFRLHIFRSIHLTSLWQNATNLMIIHLDPCAFGYKEDRDGNCL